MQKKAIVLAGFAIYLGALLSACYLGPTQQPGPTWTPTTAPLQPTFTAVPATATTTTTPTRPAPPTATPSPTRTPAPPSVRVTADLLNVRAGPSLSAAILVKVEKDTRLKLIGRNVAGDWLQVQLSDGRSGWVAVQWVEASVPPMTLPISEAPTPAATIIPATATRAPTTAPTLGPAPVPLQPIQDHVFVRGEPIVLSWKWDGFLEDNTYFVVTIAYPHNQATWYDVHWVKETSFKPPAYLNDLITGSRRCVWTVQVMRLIGTKADGTKEGEPVSQPSIGRAFIWGD